MPQTTQPPKFRSEDGGPGPGDYCPERRSSSNAGQFSFQFRRKPLAPAGATTPAANAYNIRPLHQEKPGQFTASFYAPTGKTKRLDKLPGPASYNVKESFRALSNRAGSEIMLGSRVRVSDSALTCISPQKYHPNPPNTSAARQFSFGARYSLPTAANASPGPQIVLPNYSAISKKLVSDIEMKPLTHKTKKAVHEPGPADYQNLKPDVNKAGAGYMGSRYKKGVKTF